jgi:CRP-like cAMP-binding protein
MYKSNSGLGEYSNRFAFNYVSCYSKVAAFKSATALILTVVLNKLTLEQKTEYLELFKSYLEKDVKISEESFEALRSEIVFREIPKGEYLIRTGQVARNLYFVCKGIIISEWPDLKGDLHIKNFFIEGNIATSTVSSLTKEPSNFNIKAVLKSEIISINYEKFKEIIFSFEDLKSFYIGYLERSWIITNERRQISFAAEDGMTRYRSFLSNYPGIINRVPLKLIAHYLGITPTQLSRIRKAY